jgi:hypothetical protein
VLSRTGKSAELKRVVCMVGQKKVLAYSLTVPGLLTKSAHPLDSANRTQAVFFSSISQRAPSSIAQGAGLAVAGKMVMGTKPHP